MRVEATGPCAQQFICFWHGHTDAADTSGYRGIWFATNCRKQARQNARLLLSLQINITPLIWSSFFCYVAHQNAMNAPAVPDRHSEGWPDWSILIVDDEAGMRNFLIKTLAPRCHFVMNAGSAEEGAEWLGSHHVDLIILDISLPGKNGVTWLKELREQGYAGQVIIITAFAELDTAIEALRAGASDFILKPFRVPQILNSVKQCVERARLQRENYVLRRNQAQAAPGLGALVGQSAAMNQLRTTLTRLTQVHSNVLLQGESGTGKELVARAIHSGSPRANAPFVPVNCAALSHELLERELFGHAKGAFAGAAQSREGLFRYAQGGTLFLDEVAELPLPVQATLLQAIDELNIRPVGSEQRVPVNVRIIAATTRPLADLVTQGLFRRDLYHRLKVVDLTLPPLREHIDDIPAMVGHFLAQLGPELGLPTIQVNAEHMAYLQGYAWPGNCRELRNLMERSLILGELNVSALYPGKPVGRHGTPGTGTVMHGTTDLHALEKQHILTVLTSVDGDKTRAAQLLGVSRRTLERRVAEWNLT
jgi:DNA-binding NtrC family response regulator